MRRSSRLLREAQKIPEMMAVQLERRPDADEKLQSHAPVPEGIAAVYGSCIAFKPTVWQDLYGYAPYYY
jgi:hypothetical protein